MSFTDSKSTIEDLKEIVKNFRDKRRWLKYHNPKDLAISISIEASELLELFQWRNSISAREAKRYKKLMAGIRDEIADILIYTLSFSDILDIDLSKVVHDKIKRNERRFPAKKWREKSDEYLGYR
ncbi:MAG: nucleotide pyrophosphohydrolase [Candidatus Parvarchaeota archaeon]|nr:nucleotide pyrophosphohydrolase [Candidatus Jingweiarchaeum tengchongense]MCW1298217.1 nucleotide pyrophosphohydrolase [Candidatus Jingweiarchaeum tengchongense]MCW1300015.1 nucleotide pyrophosphohydrolase [Candidatus Jingweiarchaeum tengchongense]MCW1304846.1 nucleotide pyrophosphohydrolase [Candidatus Jingweiarchaeum tengchongense]MCW1305436.1 nucleotide pyrophosphohydrolase [Candidatus Jingweiarchaeum tengchongense]